MKPVIANTPSFYKVCHGRQRWYKRAAMLFVAGDTTFDIAAVSFRLFLLKEPKLLIAPEIFHDGGRKVPNALKCHKKL